MTRCGQESAPPLTQLLPERISTRITDRLAAAHDASHYLLVPQAVATPRDVDEVALLLRATGRPLTFRSGGTSLSGQAGTDQLLVDTRRHFRGVTVHDDGARVSVQPGATLRQVNARLAPHGRRLGPDPASEVACTIGGIVANNSSGMTCGTTQNTYATLESAVLVLAGGTVLDTASPGADRRLREREPSLYQGLVEVRDQLLARPDLVESVRAAYRIKNTMGYGLNSLLDFTDPVDVLLHLVVGSEGTLAFVAEATFRTVPVRAHAGTALLMFEGLGAATDSIAGLVDAGFATVELLDSRSLRLAGLDALGVPSFPIVEHAALLVELQELDAPSLADRTADVGPVLDRLPLSLPWSLTTDTRARHDLWHMRKGLYTTVASNRPGGTTALLEDVAVPVDALAATCDGLTLLFDKYGYDGSVIFGHAKDGNVHFLINEGFDQQRGIERYLAFTEDMVELVLDHRGTLKAEHGTGRVMAPFVRRQYGDELYGVMQRIKRVCDPHAMLNPGVLITADDRGHVTNLKTTPLTDVEVDACVECGYCEPACPSADLTLTPRQRIVLRRERAHAADAGDTTTVEAIDDHYGYDGVDTCAVDGMCQVACPVGINTGSLVKRLRSERHRPVEERLWTKAADHWDVVTRSAGVGLSAAKHLPAPLVSTASRGSRRVVDADVMPAISDDLPGGGRRRADIIDADATIVFFPSCTGTMFGPAGGSAGVSAAFAALCTRAGVRYRTPREIRKLCCGTPWSSKGYLAGEREVVGRTLRALWSATERGRLPVVCDASSCSEGLRHHVEEQRDRYPGLTVVDVVDFAATELLPRITVSRPLPSVTVHPTCSGQRLGLAERMASVANAVAETVMIPTEARCCAFAGDRGMLHPELTASATAREAAQVAAAPTHAYVSTNRTCEIGMTRATGREYQHLLEVLEQVTR